MRDVTGMYEADESECLLVFTHAGFYFYLL